MPEQADSSTDHSITVGGKAIAYTAVAGTITVGGTDQFDAMLGLDGKLLADTGMNPPDATKPEDAPATARMFYTGYFKQGEPAGTRPVMFLYNGGPGSASDVAAHGLVWPAPRGDAGHRAPDRRAVHDGRQPVQPAGCTTDLVFIDAPGTGFSRIMGKDAAKAFWSIDGDAHAFERFIRRFLTKYDRWNSPKYLFGESYGTPRSAVLSAACRMST